MNKAFEHYFTVYRVYTLRSVPYNWRYFRLTSWLLSLVMRIKFSRPVAGKK